MRRMRALGDPARIAGMARFGIRPDNALGLNMPQLRSIARGLGKDQSLATLAYVAVHDQKAPDGLFLEALPLVEQYAFDNRNFVRKAVNWALRSIGKRNAALLRAALECAGRVREQNTAAARWIASDAIRELARRG